MQRGRHPYAALSHDYMPLKRYCSFCLVGKHLSRDVTLAADKDSDLCIILSVNTTHTFQLHNVAALKTNMLPTAAPLLCLLHKYKLGGALIVWPLIVMGPYSFEIGDVQYVVLLKPGGHCKSVMDRLNR